MDIPTTPSFDLNGQRALVVGACSGLGVALAAALAEHGADVTIAVRRSGQLREVGTALKARGLSVETMKIDVTNVAMVEASIAAAGPFDVLVNSAGLARHGSAAQTAEEDFDTVTAANVRGAYFWTRAVAMDLVKAGKGGSLINVSSQMGHVGGQDHSVYCASKHAVEGFTKAMAIEFGPKDIRVNTIAPTFVATDLAQSALDVPEKRAWIMSKIHPGRIAKVEDVMGAAVFLASAASAMITGTSIKIDGGWTAA